ncbi:HIT family protein [archaeon]|nr:HIT family protein [archaeon]
MENCILCKLDENPTIIKPYKNWTTLINFKQPTLGSSLVVLNRHVDSLEGLSNEEREEYWDVIYGLGNSMRKSFQPDKINYLMLANLESHVHYHIMPRYSSKRNFGGLEWEDKNYPKLPQFNAEIKNSKLLDKLILQLRLAI